MAKWYFPGGYDLTPTGSNGAGIENFLDDIPKSLTREIIQNSMDAHDEGNKNPTRVEFQFEWIEANKLEGIGMLKEEILPRAKCFWEAKKNADTCAYLNKFGQYLNCSKIPVLKISDYNTTGLNNENFSSLVEGEGFSEKMDDSSAGSKGIGKAAPFAASNLRIVFYNSKSNRDGNKFAGIINFVSYEDKCQSAYSPEGRKFITQSRGRLREESAFNCFKTERSSYGTDVFVVALKQRDDWKEKIILTVITDFLIAILKRKLEVVVDKYLINLESLPDIIEKIKTTETIYGWKLKAEDKKDFRNTYSYYVAMTSDKRFEAFLPPELVKRYSFIEEEEDAILSLVLVEDNPTRRVLQTRKTGMRIYERKSISGSIPFAGVFYAKGKKLNKFLRRLENVNHDQWSADRVSDNERKEASEFLTDLFHWYRDEVSKCFGVSGEEDMPAYGMAELLPMKDDNSGQNNGGTNKDTGITPKIKDAEIKVSESRGQVNGDEGTDKILKKLADEVYIGLGDSSGSGSRREGGGGGNSPDNRYGSGEPGGNRGENNEGDQVVDYKYKEVGIPKYLKLKVIEVDASRGKYRLIGVTTEEKNKLAVEFRIVGENGSEQAKTILRGTSVTNLVEVKAKKIIVHNICKHTKFVVDFEIDELFRLKMKGVVYEITG